jgi:hypothetical protein
MNKNSNARQSWWIVIPIALWLCSFFLPAIIFPPDNASHWAPADGMQRGYDAALLSLTAGVMNAIALAHSIHGVHFSWATLFQSAVGFLWLANLWMIITPFRVTSLSRGRSTLLPVTLWLWVAAPLPLVWQSSQPGPDGLRPFTLHLGFFLWWFSLLLLAFLSTAIRSSRSGEPQHYPTPRAWD